MSNGFCGMAMGGLRFIFGLEHQCYPSVLTGLEMETEAIRNHLNLINLNRHVTPPLKNAPITEVPLQCPYPGCGMREALIAEQQPGAFPPVRRMTNRGLWNDHHAHDFIYDLVTHDFKAVNRCSQLGFVKRYEV